MTDKPTSYYDILNVSSGASDEDIKRAYHALARRYHPDRNPQNRRMAALRFRLISEAYAGIKTKERRRAYDMMRQGKMQKPGNDNKAKSWLSVILGQFQANENSETHG